MSFEAEVRRFAALAQERQAQVVARVGDLAFASVVEGSPVTGAPGQPVVSGDLKRSWGKTVTPEVTMIETSLFYAPWIEHGMLPEGGGLEDGPSPGGPHSLKLTVAGFDRLVDQAVREVGGA